MSVSVCMASFNREPRILGKVLDSIYAQPREDCEVIVVDDGSKFGAPEVCKNYPVIYKRIAREPTVRNPSVARNVAYRLAKGNIVIAQSDDVVHQGSAIADLCGLLTDCSFVIGTVVGCDAQGTPEKVYTGAWNGQRRHIPLFFLGALWRKDLYAIGGNDEDFDTGKGNGGHEDKWFAQCLTKGLKLNPVYTKRVLGYHMNHPRPSERSSKNTNRRLYKHKLATGNWCASGGPWQWED